MLGGIGTAAAVFADLGAGTASAGHDPVTPRIEFHNQTRRLDVDTPSVLVARADLPEGGFVMVHDKPASGGHHGSAETVADVSGESTSSTDDGGGGSGGEDHSGHGHMHDVFGITNYLAPGHYGGIRVPLQRVPESGTYELVGMLHKDNGNEEFDGHGQDPHYRTDDSDLHVDADVRFISPPGRSR